MFEKRPVIALDFQNKKQVEEFLSKFDEEEKLYCKIGMEFFYGEGFEVVQFVIQHGHSVFLDLKLHDIPHTVKCAMRNLARLGVEMVNVHAAGGVEMMQQALVGLEEGTPEGKQRPKILAVTQLTSTSEEEMHEDQLIQVSLQESVVHYASKAKEAGLDGVVCSALEVEMIKEAVGEDFICLTPGIRPNGYEVGDQTRIMTPDKAKDVGSDYIVVGRPIIKSDDPVAVYHQIKKEWNHEA